MPIYEYECRACERRVEAIQQFSDPPLTECAECGGDLKKMVSAPAFQFKGSGWYVTDYARQGNGGPEADKGDKGDKDKGDKKEGDGKAAEKSPAGESGKSRESGESRDSSDSKSSGKSSSSTGKTAEKAAS